MSDLFTLNDLEKEGGNKEKLMFAEYIPVKMTILETKDGALENTGFPYYVLGCKVNNGDHAGKTYDLFINTKYKNKEGVKGTYGFKKVLQGLAKDYSAKEIKEGRANDLPESFKTQLEGLIGKDIEVAFFPPDNGYQNLIYVKDLSKTTEETGDGGF